MGVIFQPFSVYPTSSTHYNSQISLCTIISKLLIFNVAGQSQILLLHFLLTALTIPQSLILLASLLFSLSPSLFISTPLFLCRPSFSLFPSHTHTQNTLFLSYPFCPPPLSWVLEDLSKLRGRKSTFLPHQPAKPGVEKEQLKAPLLLMLTANANAPFAKHEGQWAQAKG